MIGPTADPVEDKLDTTTSADHMERIVSQVRQMVNGISPRDVITSFAGLRPVLDTEDFYIDRSQKVPHFIQVAGIQSPGLTASPAIGEYVKDLLKADGLTLAEKTQIVQKLPPRREIRRETPEQLDKLHADDPRWTHVVCRCENVSEAEIIEAVRKGHTTLDGVKFYTRAGMGRCQGGFCSAKIMKIISRETGIPMDELTKKGGSSRLLGGKLGSRKIDDMPEK
jgi:glycerol-3-phosphate dehydrogenase